ncbi:hypothetical protein [Paenibacillus amylolyticus]|uniref:hypothetical protein n=1 Tax=Paenibacillus amylolyticus TaxID=1451 RepID=UPI003EB97294
MAQLIDVTLRDGGYVNRFDFSLEAAKHIVSGLQKAGVDWIEIGYRNGPAKGTTGLGMTAATDDDYIAALKEFTPLSNLVVMFHPDNIQVEDLQSLKRLGVSLVRVCIRQDCLEEGLDTIRACKRIGLFTSANFVRITYFTSQELRQMTQKAEEAGADIVYFADSNGHLVPDQVKSIATILKSTLTIPVGFHAHNNLSLGLANTVAALELGVDWIDSSLRGMGRSGGNLATEVYAAYIERCFGVKNLKLVEVMEAAEFVQDKVLLSEHCTTPMIKDILFGLMNFSTDLKQSIMDASREYNVNWKQLAYRIGINSSNKITSEGIAFTASQISKNNIELQHM